MQPSTKRQAFRWLDCEWSTHYCGGDRNRLEPLADSRPRDSQPQRPRCPPVARRVAPSGTIPDHHFGDLEELVELGNDVLGDALLDLCEETECRLAPARPVLEDQHQHPERGKMYPPSIWNRGV